MKKFAVLSLKIILLTILYFVFMAIGSAVLGPKVERNAADATVFAATLLVCFVDTLVLTLVILRSNWSGWKLMVSLAVVYYGVQTFMAQIESAYFGPALGIPPSWLPGLFMMSLPVVVFFIPLAVWILGKGRNGADKDPSASERLSMPASDWIWKLAVIAVMYVVLYFSFGYFVAWSNPHLAAMYGNGANKEVFDYAKLIPLQLVRGILWALFVLPIIRLSKGSPIQIGLIVGILLALPMNMPHFIPNPLMPDPTVRMSHFIETATSNFIFGTLLTLLILRRPHAAPKAVPASTD